MDEEHPDPRVRDLNWLCRPDPDLSFRDTDPTKERIFDNIKLDPASLMKWTWDELHAMVFWFCGIHAEKSRHCPELDLPVLHCLLTCGKIRVDDQLQTPCGEGIETALSLAVYANNLQLVEYLLKMGASPDELVGWDPCAQRPGSFAFDRPRTDGLRKPYQELVLRLCDKPCRESPDEVMLDGGMAGAEFVQKVEDYNAIEGLSPGIEFDIAQAKLNPDVVESWTRLHCTYVFARLIKRRPRGPIPSDYFLIDLLLASGKVGVNDNLVGCGFERVTPLHEAVVSKNVDFVRYSLHKHRADPNVRCFVDGMPWNDITHIVYPLGVALRAFLVWDDGEQEATKTIVDLLLDSGTRLDVQVETIDAISQQNVVSLMNFQEGLHFIRMVQRLVKRDQRIFGQLHTPLSISIPELLSACEQKWMKIGLEEFPQKGPRFSQVLSEGTQLIMLAIESGSPYPRQEVLMHLTTSRSHQTLAGLASALGGRLPLHEADLDRIRFLNPYTEEHAEAGLTPQDIYTRDALRIIALMTILIKSTAASQNWMPFLNHLHTFILRPKPRFPVDYFTLKNLSMGIVNDLKRQGRLDDDSLKSIPPLIRNELAMEREFDALDGICF